MAQLQMEFPGATVKASTFDEFVLLLNASRSSLPVLTSEMGDTWYHVVCPPHFKRPNASLSSFIRLIRRVRSLADTWTGFTEYLPTRTRSPPGERYCANALRAWKPASAIQTGHTMYLNSSQLLLLLLLLTPSHLLEFLLACLSIHLVTSSLPTLRSATFYNFSRQLIKGAEHTWGLQSATLDLYLLYPYNNSEFQRLRADSHFANMEVQGRSTATFPEIQSLKRCPAELDRAAELGPVVSDAGARRRLGRVSARPHPRRPRVALRHLSTIP